MKDYALVVRTFLATREKRLEKPLWDVKPVEMSDAQDVESGARGVENVESQSGGERTFYEVGEADLVELLRAAYDDGALEARAEEKAPYTVSDGTGTEVLSDRKEDELLRRTNKILGDGARTLGMLRSTPHKLRAVAAHARVEPKVMKDFLDGRTIRTAVAAMIRRSFRQLGFPTEPGAAS